MTDQKEHQMHHIAISSFFDPAKPWVLVPNGSFMGFFDWVPSNLRNGKWSVFAPIYIVVIIWMVFYTLPSRFEFTCSYPEPFSTAWFYNGLNFIWMSTVLITSFIKSKAGVSIIMTYTIQSWIVITARHGLTAVAPFLPKEHFLLFLNELLRFLSLVTATVTFVVWNFLIGPVIYYKFMETPKKKHDFLTFMLSFRLVQVHGFNIIFAVLNSVIIAPRKFTFIDLWCSTSFCVLYSLFYLFILDRLGVHLYPIFSPRSNYFVVTWTFAYGCYFMTYYFWNKVIDKYILIDSFQ